MITIKEYAKQHSISYEAVRAQIKRYETELADLIVVDGRQRLLTDEAVAFLDSKRLGNPVVVRDMELDAQLKQLEAENKALLLKLAATQEKVIELTNINAELRIALNDTENKLLLLESNAKQSSDSESVAVQAHQSGAASEEQEPWQPEEQSEPPAPKKWWQFWK